MPVGREQQQAGLASEAGTLTAAAVVGFIGWSPDPDRTVYKVTSSNQRGPVETAIASGRLPQHYR